MVLRSLERSSGLDATAKAQPSAGKLKVLLADISVTVCSPIDGSRAATGQCLSTGSSTRPQWISSETMISPRRRQNSASALNSSRDHTRPVGLCGLQATATMLGVAACSAARSPSAIVPRARRAGRARIPRFACSGEQRKGRYVVIAMLIASPCAANARHSTLMTSTRPGRKTTHCGSIRQP
jgi:hypothetical protein